MAVTDPVDARLLAALAELGKAAVHELAAKVGMDPREVAYRLVALSGSGLPLLVGVESDPNGLRAALATARPAPPPPYPAQGMPSGAYTVPSAAYNVPSGRYPVQPPPPAPGRFAAAAPRPAVDPVISTWGPPQTASWARGDQRQAPSPVQRTGRIGDALAAQGLEGEQLTIQLLEVQDPADFLFGAAGYRLDAGERAVVVHTEITNRGTVPFVSLPDNYLELVTAEGTTIAKAPVSLTSRPPHKIGVQPGETAGGHTVYVLPEATRVTTLRWSPRPEPDERTLSWSLET
ncbi:AsnC family transcriptional regulator [Amycolatopsis sp. K13G38]|uniref:AsnC family transcriptional regulator n=1 Tax=Amycolatopsis acididurans TaxID=2724524 RepID=A0ABX1JEP4_9PSEU|nr:AsnC family transcriptional regulator [Amycolatopsis acididurans]NKQ57185.1 AsnC family transcriptional regulator [Amycolatopsis acididurans]